MTEFKLKNGCGRFCARGCGRQNNQLNTYDWLADIPGNDEACDMVEVQFKNTRKGYYKNSNKLKLDKGDIVAVEASPGHDIGTVTLTGRLVPLQMKKANLKPDTEIKRIYRKAKPVDMEKYEEAKAKEHDTMIRSRQIAASLNLNMKIGDVEYQGDGNKAIFYYIADERVDFRQLIKVLADAFHVRIEMKQIGARQEAGRIGGIGPCGRELCCATWMKNFVSVSTNAARIQDISLNPQKLAGQCAKLKCCMNYEVDAYVEAAKRMPSREVTLETKDGTFYFFKADVLKGEISYSTDKNFAANLVTISGKRAFEVLNMNRNGIKPDSLKSEEPEAAPKRPADFLEQESLTRFDKSKRNKNKKKKGNAPSDKTPEPNLKAATEKTAQGGKPNNAPQEGKRNDNRKQDKQQGGQGENRKPQKDKRNNPQGGKQQQPQGKQQQGKPQQGKQQQEVKPQDGNSQNAPKQKGNAPQNQPRNGGTKPNKPNGSNKPKPKNNRPPQEQQERGNKQPQQPSTEKAPRPVENNPKEGNKE